MTVNRKSAFAVLVALVFLASALPAAARPQTLASAGQGEPGAVVFSLRPPQPAKSVTLAGTFNAWNPTATPMGDADGDGVWQATVTLTAGRHLYKFIVDGKWQADPANGRTEPDGQGGFNSLLVLGGAAFEGSSGSAALGPWTGPDAVTPEWARRAVWYQIFPERFRNGDPRNDPPGTVAWTHPWFERAPNESGDFYKYIFERRYGGDLQGVRERLDYLESLGVTALYFNPVFESPSLHKYDTADFRHIDDNFGVKGDLAKLKGETDDPKTWQWTSSDRLFLELVAECHRRGMKVIVDGVFNHTGNEHYAFKDVLKNGKASPYANWYKIKSWGPPVEYVGWFNVDTLPEVAQTPTGLNDDFKKHIFAVTKRWMDPNGDGNPSDGIDGWRLDVPNLIPLGFWEEWRALVKGVNRDAYIVGEIWDPVPQMLDGKTFDAQMNSPLLRAVIRFFVDSAPRSMPSEFAKEIADLRALYPKSVVAVQQNLLDSHDTDRAVSMIVNPNRRFDAANRLQDPDGKAYDTRKPDPAAYQRLKLITIFQMTYLGAPMIWYGDEVGMFGADDPTDRKPMVWKDLQPYGDPDDVVDDGLLEHYRKLLAIRNSYDALQVGEYRQLLADDTTGILAFERMHAGKRIIVVINNSDRTQWVKVPVERGSWHDALNDTRYRFAKLTRPETGLRQVIAFDRKAEHTYTAEDGHIHVRITGGWASILVEDVGAGSRTPG